MKTHSSLVYISDSKIHGKGLFAAKAIGKDELIGQLQGRHCQHDGIYVLWLDDNTAFEVSCRLKYINHSEQPNACYYDDLTVIALRDINAHEEITHDYEISEFSD